mgnify:CR=1 FL=1
MLGSIVPIYLEVSIKNINWLCWKKNVENRRYLNDILPRDYLYKITSFSLIDKSLVLCETKFDATFLINICSKEMLDDFLVQFCELSKTEYNIDDGDRKNWKLFQIACIRKCETEEIITEALTIYRDMLPPGAFYNKVFPSLVMLHDCDAEINAVRNVFPESKVLLCTWQLTTASWRWLLNSNNGIHKDDKQYLQDLFTLPFTAVVYAVDYDLGKYLQIWFYLLLLHLSHNKSHNQQYLSFWDPFPYNNNLSIIHYTSYA